MISAKEAREYSVPTCDELCAHLESCVVSSAGNGNRSCTIWDEPFCNWLVLGINNLPTESQECIEQLLDLGYQLELVYKQNRMKEPGLKVSWLLSD